MKHLFAKYAIISTLLFPLSAFSQTNDSTWNLPKEISDQNTTINFTVDSTWHTVHGTTSELGGDVHLKSREDTSSVTAEIIIPVSSFNTHNQSRDEELLDVMNQKEFPNVIFKANKLSGNCTPDIVKQNISCRDTLTGSLTIKDVTKDISIPLLITAKNDNFIVTGKISFKWADYKVEDPSIFLVATVDPDVEINFEIKL